MQRWRPTRPPHPFVPFAQIEPGHRFRFPASDDVNTKLQGNFGWYTRPDGDSRSVTGTTLVVPVDGTEQPAARG